MKLITFNTWGGRAGPTLIKDFFDKYKKTDVFCLQEIWQLDDPKKIETWDERINPNLLHDIASYLPQHKFFFKPQYRNVYGLATFVHRDIPIKDEGEIFVFKEQGFENPVSPGNHARNIQYVTLNINGAPLTIINFHGLWNGRGKEDSDDRILQSQKIQNFIKSLSHPYILAGDFNLNPSTQSYKLLSDVCNRDLIQDHQITSTRTSFYEKPGKYADYILTGKGIEVGDFKILPDEASDHLALSLTLNL